MNRAMVLFVLLLVACAPTPSFDERAQPSTPVVQLAAFQAQVNATPTPIPDNLIDAADAEYLLLSNIYERVNPSVVNLDVTVETTVGRFNDQASGSGFVYDEQGHIITNAHVVSDAREIRVTFYDGVLVTAEVVGVDVFSDLAVVRVDTDRSRLLPVVFGDSDTVRVGQRAIAIGNPFGLASSMTVGIVSGLGRQLPSAELLNSALSGFENPSIIQVDAEINPGNSGGPLLNSRGQVIGVNTAIRTESGVFQGVGFAVPARTVLRVIPELIERGRVEYSWLGISTIPAANGFSVAGLAADLSLPVSAGVLVENITPNSPAAEAGLRGGSRMVDVRGRTICAGGDIIVAINGQYVRSMDELVAYLIANTRPDETVTMLIVRGDETFDVPVTLRARPNSSVGLPACGAS